MQREHSAHSGPAPRRGVRHLLQVGVDVIRLGPVHRRILSHRLRKADTEAGLVSVQSSADLGVPYSMLLYGRLLGRPFAGHRDSVSELIGNIVENAIEDVLCRERVSYPKTKTRRVAGGLRPKPDFVVPNEFNPQVVIEAKLTEDVGAARDKVTRVQHLGTLSMAGRPEGQPKFEVVACIAGRGFGVRREDMHELLLHSRKGLHAPEHESTRGAHSARRASRAVAQSTLAGTSVDSPSCSGRQYG